MKKYILFSLVLGSFVLGACEEAFEAIEALDGPANCEASRAPIDEINEAFDYFISRTETSTILTDEEKATKIEDFNNARNQAINGANNDHCR